MKYLFKDNFKLIKNTHINNLMNYIHNHYKKYKLKKEIL